MAPCSGLACRIALPRAPSPLPRCGLREREREARPSAFAFSPATRRGRTGPCRSLMSAPFCRCFTAFSWRRTRRVCLVSGRAPCSTWHFTCSLPASPFRTSKLPSLDLWPLRNHCMGDGMNCGTWPGFSWCDGWSNMPGKGATSPDLGHPWTARIRGHRADDRQILAR